MHLSVFFLGSQAHLVFQAPKIPRELVLAALTDFLSITQTCRQLLTFCELFDSLQRDLEWASWPLDLDTLESGLKHFRTATRRV